MTQLQDEIDSVIHRWVAKGTEVRWDKIVDNPTGWMGKINNHSQYITLMAFGYQTDRASVDELCMNIGLVPACDQPTAQMRGMCPPPKD